MVRKAESSVAADGVGVAISRFGHDPIPVCVADGATVADVLEKADLSLEGNQQVFNAGEQVEMSDIVEDGDVLSIVSPKAAGAR